MARHKAKELDANAHHAQPYVAPDMRGRVTHAEVWRRAQERWKPGMRVTVEFSPRCSASGSKS